MKLNSREFSFMRLKSREFRLRNKINSLSLEDVYGIPRFSRVVYLSDTGSSVKTRQWCRPSGHLARTAFAEPVDTEHYD